MSFRGVSREIPRERNGNSRIRYAAGRGRPALPTATPRIGHNVISSVSQEVSLREKRNFTHSRQTTRQRGLRAEKSPAIETKIIIHPLPQTLASRGSLPRQSTSLRRFSAEKTSAVETKITEYDQPQIFARGGYPPRNRKGNNHTRTTINIVIGRRDNRFPSPLAT